MNLAYDEHSVDALLDEARDRWGEIPDAGGSEMEDDEPLDVLEFWYLKGDVPPESPPLSPQATDSDLEPSARGGSLSSPRRMRSEPTPTLDLKAAMRSPLDQGENISSLRATCFGSDRP